MKKSIAVLAVGAAMAIAPTSAIASNGASGNAPGYKIQNACGASFGQLVASGKSAGDAVHGNYAGGANAFSANAVLAAHGCSVNG